MLLRSIVSMACIPLLAAIVEADDKLPRTISVTGTGSVSAAPDRATIHTGLVTQADTAEKALAQNNQDMQQVMDALVQHGVDRKDIQTSSFDIQPIHERDDEGRQQPEITGYRVQNQLRVHVRDLENIGQLLDMLVKAGSNQISGIQFGIDEEAKLLNQVRVRAIEDARTSAQILAHAAGVRLGHVRQISDNSSSIPQPRHMGFEMMGMKAANVPVATGEQEIRVSVQVVFQLKTDSDDQ